MNIGRMTAKKTGTILALAASAAAAPLASGVTITTPNGEGSAVSTINGGSLTIATVLGSPFLLTDQNVTFNLLASDPRQWYLKVEVTGTNAQGPSTTVNSGYTRMYGGFNSGFSVSINGLLQYNPFGLKPEDQGLCNIQMSPTAFVSTSPPFLSQLLGSGAPANQPISFSYTAKGHFTNALRIPGDANNDGFVNMMDYTALAANFNSSGATWEQGDFNGDGVVNAIDFNALAIHYGISVAAFPATPAEPLNGSVVPEPAVLGMLATAATLLALPRRRR